MAMASCVKPLAVPAPVPGPCDASTASDAKTIGAIASAKVAMPCLIPDVMTTSFDGPRSRYGDILRRFPACGDRSRLAIYCGSAEEVVMKTWVGVAFVAAALAFSAPAASAGNKGVPQAKAATSDATEFSARRVFRRYPSYPAYARSPSY